MDCRTSEQAQDLNNMMSFYKRTIIGNKNNEFN